MKFLGCRGGGENSCSLNGGKISLHVGTTCHITRCHTAEDPGCKIKGGGIPVERIGTTGAKTKSETNNEIQ